VAKDKLESQGPAFHALLDWFNPDRERAAEEYVRLHRRISKMFEARGCLMPEDCADETFNRVGCQLAESKEIRTNNPVFYIDGVARHILREQWNRPAHDQVEEISAHDEPRESDDKREKEQRHTCLEKCLRDLSAESRMLLLEYYAEDKIQKIEARNRMAQRLGIAAGVLRNRIFKMRISLRRCVDACLAE
jgi:DNA-directed RNA polymerase specialized sigma24 family protein